MPSTRILRVLAIAITAFLCAGFAMAQSVGVVLDVMPGAIVERDGKRGRLVDRSSIVTGDVIRTDASGTVQIVFNDRTRIAIGPNTRFVVEDVQIGTGERARRFVVRVLSGTFRFLSGESAKESYQIKTPTATLGIRGTIFDVAVEQRGQTNVVTHEGVVRMCGRGRRCADVFEGCAMARTMAFGRVGAPRDRAERDSILVRAFPFVLSQSQLQPAFRARTENCGDVERTTLAIPPAVATSRPTAGTAQQRSTSAGSGGNSAASAGGSAASGGGTQGAGGSSGGGQSVKDAIPSGGS